MKKVIILLFLITTVSISYAVELGIILGEPTGVSFRTGLAKGMSMDFQLGWSTRSENFDIHGAYIFHNKTISRIEGRPLVFFYGPGGRLKAKEKEFVLGFKFPFGLYYKFKSIPFSLSGELAPGLNIGSEMEFDLLGGVSFRFIF